MWWQRYNDYHSRIPELSVAKTKDGIAWDEIRDVFSQKKVVSIVGHLLSLNGMEIPKYIGKNKKNGNYVFESDDEKYIYGVAKDGSYIVSASLEEMDKRKDISVNPLKMSGVKISKDKKSIDSSIEMSSEAKITVFDNTSTMNLNYIRIFDNGLSVGVGGTLTGGQKLEAKAKYKYLATDPFSADFSFEALKVSTNQNINYASNNELKTFSVKVTAGSKLNFKTLRTYSLYLKPSGEFNVINCEKYLKNLPTNK